MWIPSHAKRRLRLLCLGVSIALLAPLAACKKEPRGGKADYLAVAQSCLNADTGGAKYQLQLAGSACAECCKKVKASLEDSYSELEGLGGGASFGVNGRCRCHVPVECPGWTKGQDCMSCCEKNKLYISVEGPASNAFTSARGGSSKKAQQVRKWNRCYCTVLYPANE